MIRDSKFVTDTSNNRPVLYLNFTQESCSKLLIQYLMVTGIFCIIFVSVMHPEIVLVNRL